MQLNYESANASCSGFISNLNGGAISFHDSGDSEIINCAMNTPAFDNPVSGVSAMSTSSTVQDVSTGSGVIDHAHFLQADDSIYSQMTCATSGAEFNFSTLEFDEGETLVIDSLSVGWTATTLT